MKTPKRPPSVPETAEWDAVRNAWEWGARDPKGRQGAWTSVRAKDGTLFWRGTFRDGKQHGDVTYFAEDGKTRTLVMSYESGAYKGMQTLAPAEKPKPRAKIPRPKLRGSAYERLIGLDEALRRAKNPDYERVVFRKVKPAEIAQAEKQLRVKLPPSYVAFVNEHGTFHVAGDGATYDKLLGPLKAAKLTLAIRKGDLEDRDLRFLKDAICFQENPYSDDYFVFRVSSRRKDGEMSVGAWSHDDVSSWGKGFTTFEAHVAKLCDKWLDEIAS